MYRAKKELINDSERLTMNLKSLHQQEFLSRPSVVLGRSLEDLCWCWWRSAPRSAVQKQPGMMRVANTGVTAVTATDWGSQAGEGPPGVCKVEAMQ